MKAIPFLTLALALACTGFADTPAADTAVQVKLLSVRQIFHPSAPSLGLKRGTEAVLMLTAPAGKRFIDGPNRHWKSTLDCRDGAGRPLNEASSYPYYDTTFGLWSEDAPTMTVHAETRSISADGVLRLKGHIPVTLTTGTQDQPAARLAFQEGASTTAAGYHFSVSSVQQEGRGVEVTITIKGKGEPAGIVFRDAEGKELKTGHSGGTRTVANDGDMEMEYTYGFRKAVKEADVVVQTWAGVEEVDVPVDMSIRLDGSRPE